MPCGRGVGPLPVKLHRRRRVLVTALGLYIAGTLVGCAGDGPPPAGTGGEYDAIQADIFNVYCLGSGCHNSVSAAGGLVLEAGLSYDELVEVLPENPTARDAGLWRVRPSDPSGSFLLTKLTGPEAGEGSLMPLGGSPLSSGDIDQIRGWIVAGAPPPATPTPEQPGD